MIQLQYAWLSCASHLLVANVRTEFPPGGQKILKKNTSHLKYIQLEIAIIKNEILNLKIFELQKILKSKNFFFWLQKFENSKLPKIERDHRKWKWKFFNDRGYQMDQQR